MTSSELPLSPVQVMDRLIEFAYTASISVGEKCVIHVMNGAVMYQIDSVVKACCDFLVQQLDPSNAIGIASFAEQIGCTELHQKAREYIYLNFSQVRRAAVWGFCRLNLEFLRWRGVPVWAGPAHGSLSPPRRSPPRRSSSTCPIASW